MLETDIYFDVLAFLHDSNEDPTITNTCPTDNILCVCVVVGFFVKILQSALDVSNG